MFTFYMYFLAADLSDEEDEEGDLPSFSCF